MNIINSKKKSKVGFVKTQIQQLAEEVQQVAEKFMFDVDSFESATIELFDNFVEKGILTDWKFLTNTTLGATKCTQQHIFVIRILLDQFLLKSFSLAGWGAYNYEIID